MEITPFKIGRMEVDEKKVCKGIDYFSDFTTNLFTMATESIPVLGKAISSGIAIVKYFGKKQLSTGCKSKPFAKIKKILENRFDKIEKDLERNYRAIRLVSEQVSQTRLEVQQGFAQVLQSIRSSRIEPLVFKLNSFIEFFKNEKGRISNLPHDEYLIKLKEEENILIHLKASRMAMDASLHTSLNEIMDGGYAIPQNFTDTIASNALHALCYGTQTYISIMDFLLEQYFYLAQYHYEKLELDAYNNYIDMLKSTFEDFKYSLIDISNTNAIIPHVLQTLYEVTEKYSNRCDTEDLCKFAIENIKDFSKDIENIENMTLPIIIDAPEKFNGKIQFTSSDIKPPMGDWVTGTEVRYAIQYEKNGEYSKIGDWSDPYVIKDKTNPLIKLYFDANNNTRLVFRKFNEDKPQLIGIFEGENGQESRDINRDILNAASRLNEDIAKDEMNKLLVNKVDFDATFEGGKRVIHAAVEANNIKLVEKYILPKSKLGINVQDSKGRSPLHIASEAGHEDFVTFLIENKADVNAKTKEGLTPLHIAAKKGNAPVIEALLKAPNMNVSETDKNNFTPLHSAVAGGYHALKTLLSDRNVNINAKSNEGLTALHLAAIDNNLVAIITLTKTKRDCQNLEFCKIDINIANEEKMAALHFASMFGYREIVQFLINQEDVNINALSNEVMTPLHYALSFKRKEIAIDFAKHKKVNLNLATKDQVYPLHTAIETNQNDVAKELIKNGAAIEAKTSEGLTSLHTAAKFKNTEMAEFLLDELNADIKVKSINGSTPLHFAAEANDDKIVKLLLNKGADNKALDNNSLIPVQIAVMRGNIEAVRELVKHDSSQVKVKNNEGDSLIHLASKRSNLKMIKYLIDNGCDVNSKNNDDQSALCDAVEQDNLAVIQYLFERGAQAFTMNRDGIDCIYSASQKGYLDIIKFFVESGKFDLTAFGHGRNDDFCGSGAGTSHLVLMDAIKKNNIDVIKYILDEKQIEMNHFADCCLLIKSSESGYLDLVKYFFEGKKIKIDCSLEENKITDTPLYTAIVNNRTDIMRYIVDQGAWLDNNAKGKERIPLRSAIKMGNLDMVVYLLNKGASNDWSWNDRTLGNALHDAAASGHLDIVRYLVEVQKIGLSYGAENSYSPLHKAAQLSMDPKCEDKAEEVMKYLICKGANIKQLGVDDKSPLDLASPKVKKNIQEFVKSPNCPDFLEKINTRTKKSLFLSDDFSLIGKKSSKSKNIINDIEKLSVNKKILPNLSNNSRMKNITSEKITNFFSSSNIEHPKYQSDTQFLKNSVSNHDINSTLFLLDFLVKKFMGQKYSSSLDQTLSEYEARSEALKITAAFADLINSLSRSPVDEMIDLVHVHSNIFKAIMSGKRNLISKMLCSYVSLLGSLEPAEIETLFAAIKSINPAITPIEQKNSGKEFDRYLVNTISSYCLNEFGTGSTDVITASMLST